MSITKKEVSHIAELARIELTDKEISKFEKELSEILTFVGKLNEADTAGVAPMAGGTMSENVMRADAETDRTIEGHSAFLRESAPEEKDGWIRVKTVLE